MRIRPTNEQRVNLKQNLIGEEMRSKNIQTQYLIPPMLKLSCIKENARQYDYKITTPSDGVELVRNVLGDNIHIKEHLGVIMMSSKGSVIGCFIVSVGTLDQSIANGREIFQPLILGNARSFILFHNHPSGSLEPSQNDIKTTRVISEASKMFDIILLDSLIVTDTGYTSITDYI